MNTAFKHSAEPLELTEEARSTKDAAETVSSPIILPFAQHTEVHDLLNKLSIRPAAPNARRVIPEEQMEILVLIYKMVVIENKQSKSYFEKITSVKKGIVERRMNPDGSLIPRKSKGRKPRERSQEADNENHDVHWIDNNNVDHSGQTMGPLLNKALSVPPLDIEVEKTLLKQLCNLRAEWFRSILQMPHLEEEMRGAPLDMTNWYWRPDETWNKFHARRNRGREIFGEWHRIRDTLVRHNLRAVAQLAKSFRGQGLSYADLIQIGAMALMKGIDYHDSSYDTRVLTHAKNGIWQTMKREIANHHNRNERDNEYYLDARPMVSLDDVFLGHDYAVPLAFSKVDGDPIQASMKSDERQKIQEALHAIALEQEEYSVRTANVLSARFGLGIKFIENNNKVQCVPSENTRGKERSLLEIADQLGVTKSRIGQILEQGIEKLQEHLTDLSPNRSAL